MPKSVMVVDDSSAIRKFVMFALRAQGLNVVTAQDGMEALEKLAHTPVDLVVTDLNMPKLDGFGLVRAIREDRDYAEMPVIILTSLTDKEEEELGYRLGANAYITKPFDQKRIQYEIAKHIS
ncbi:MAG: response regulator [Rhodothermales bacterium]